jgi:hypothetical protein
LVLLYFLFIYIIISYFIFSLSTYYWVHINHKIVTNKWIDPSDKSSRLLKQIVRGSISKSSCWKFGWEERILFVCSHVPVKD